MTNITAIIPARGGSKGLPKKNILDLNGKPLIAYSIESALKSNLINKVIVSTDCPDIAAISEKFGATVPFLRPEAYSNDHSKDYEVFKHYVDWEIENDTSQSEILVQLRPTSPIRAKGLIDDALNKFITSPKHDSLRSVTVSPITPFKMWYKNGDMLEPLLKLTDFEEPYNSPRQELPVVYWQTGTIDITRRKTVIDLKSMTGKIIYPYVMNNSDIIDIDTLSDLRIASRKLRNGN